jgi:urea transport system ATP-binding protein
VQKLREEQAIGTVLADETATALKNVLGEGKMSVPLVEQYLDFCKELADTFAIMNRSVVVADPVAALTDGVVRQHLTV